MKRSIFDPLEYQLIVERINKLTPASLPAWGKMSVGQMLAHSNVLLEQALGKQVPTKRPNALMRKIIKLIILAEKPFSKNSPTGPDLIMTEPKDFEKEKAALLKNLEEIYQLGANANFKPHPAIGELKPHEWAWTIWKHTDHHLRQFGV